jgi:hypothetical protein
MKSIDLGRKMAMPEPVTASKDEEKDTTHYPTLYVDDVEALGDIPEEGEMTIRYKKVGSSVSETGGKKHHSCTLEVRKVMDVTGDESDDSQQESDDKDRGDALDKLAGEESDNSDKKVDESLPYETR